MKGLFLYGLNCTNGIWNQLVSYFSNMDIVYAEYPHEVTKEAKSVSDITNWVFDNYGYQKYDFIIGHSMGGIIALQLVSEFTVKCDKVILIESNLKPADEFYRNLLTPKHMEEYGEKIVQMIKGERLYYRNSLIESLQENYDYTVYVKNSKSEIVGMYGDRGEKNYPNRIKDLRLDDETINIIKFYFIEDSCHMPMIENPFGLYAAIMDVLSEI